MALFIELKVAPEVARDPGLVAKLVESCPVDIFAKGADGTLALVEQNLDECTLCELCLAVAPSGTLQVLKLYDGGRALERRA